MFINFLLIVGNLIMKKLKFKKLFFSFFISIFAMGAIAQEKKEIDLFKITKTPLLTWSHIIESRWNTIDNDKNNLLNQSELSSISLAFRFLSFKYFKELDTDHDGFISHKELSSYSQIQEKKQKDKINKKWSELDKDNNLLISVEEAQDNKELSKNFSNLDSNSDENISPEEMIAFYNQTLSSQLQLK